MKCVVVLVDVEMGVVEREVWVDLVVFGVVVLDCL